MSAKILIIGATGFVGSHLLNHFEQQNLSVRVFARSPNKVISHESTTEVVFGDLDQEQTIENSLKGIETIYYLAHAMADRHVDFVSKEINQANNISRYLNENQKIIYLSGIIPDEQLSQHLEARKSVGDVLRNSKAQTIEFRASIVIGDGSASFEIVRSIINKLPIIVSASWSKAKCQPIALLDVLEYLSLAGEMKFEDKDHIFNIAGSETITYDDLLSEYARFKKLYRPNFFIPTFPKEMALRVLELVAMEHYQVGSRLLESIEHETILKDDLAAKTFMLKPVGLHESFEQLNDDHISKTKISEFFDSNLVKELPQYLVGDSIQVFIPLIHKNFGDFIQYKAPFLKSFKLNLDDVITTDSFHFRIPKIGKFQFTYNKAKSGIHLIIGPEFFFQSLGLSILKKILS